MTLRIALLSPEGEKPFRQNRLAPLLARKLRGVIRFMADDRETIPCLALLTLAAMCPPRAEFLYLDEDYAPAGSTLAAVETFRPDLALVTAISHQAQRAFELLAALRTRGIHTVFGGAWATASPEEAARRTDTLVTGEAERAFPAFLSDFLAGRPRRIYRGGPDVDLAESPVPRFDILPDPSVYTKFPLFATRGCPHDCAYCGITPIYGHRIRRKAPERVVAEIHALKRVVPRPFVTFADENLLADPVYGAELLRAIAPERIAFECYADISLGDRPDLLRLLYEAGCRECLVGLESVVPETLALESNFKASRLPDYERLVGAIQGAGIPVFGLFILGLDGDGPDVFERVLAFCDRTGLANAEFASLSPIPGTRAFERLAAEGRLLCDTGGHWEKREFRPARMSPEELERGILRLYARFHEPARARERARRWKEMIRRRGAAPGCS